MNEVEIGSKYDGPCYDKPCLRQMPREWQLEESKIEQRQPWYYRSERWLAIFIALILLLGAAQISAVMQ